MPHHGHPPARVLFHQLDIQHYIPPIYPKGAGRPWSIYDGVYNVVLKTHYIRLIQRTWKKIYKEKLLYIKKMKSLNALRMRETGIIYYNNMPTLYGMLQF